jgi:predicted HicB family RNase H-like nuclease
MNEYLHYKGYDGTVEFSAADQVLYGKVPGIKDLISYEGESIAEITEDFQNAIDEYLDSCLVRNKTPNKGKENYAKN